MFNQFEITEKYRPLAAFMTHRGVYEPKRVMFGLQGGPQHAVRELSNEMLLDNLTNGVTYTEWAHQQNKAGEDPPYEMDPVLKIVKGSRLRPFVDDVKVMSNHLAGMAKLSELFFMFCENHRIVLSRKKAKVGVTHLKLLGMLVRRASTSTLIVSSHYLTPQDPEAEKDYTPCCAVIISSECLFLILDL